MEYIPETDSDSSSGVSIPKDKIQVNEPKVTQTTGNAIVSAQETKNKTKGGTMLSTSYHDGTKDKLDEERMKYKEDLYARTRKRTLNN